MQQVKFYIYIYMSNVKFIRKEEKYLQMDRSLKRAKIPKKIDKERRAEPTHGSRMKLLWSSI